MAMIYSRKLALACVITLTLAVPLRTAVRAQAPKGDEGEIVVPSGEFKSDDKVLAQRFHDGKQMSDSDKPALQRVAKWYIYRLTLSKYQDRTPDQNEPLSSARSVNDLLQELFALLVLPNPNKAIQLSPNQQRYMQEFTSALIPPIERVLQNNKQIARINAAIVLAKLGESGNEAVVKPLLAILKDKNQNDAVKLWALIGLKNLFRAKSNPDVEGFKDRDEEVDYIHELLEFLARKPSLPPNATDEEREAFRYVRREAIRALGQTRYPALLKKKVPLGRPALELVRIMRNDGISPEPTFSEQIEAAIGVCQMKAKLYPNYQLEYAIQQVGQFLLDFADKYEKERNKPNKSASWKYESARLQQALSTLAEDAPQQERAKVASFAQVAKDMLKRIENNSESLVVELRKWLDKNQPPENALYKGEKDATIKSEATE